MLALKHSCQRLKASTLAAASAKHCQSFAAAKLFGQEVYECLASWGGSTCGQCWITIAQSTKICFLQVKSRCHISVKLIQAKSIGNYDFQDECTGAFFSTSSSAQDWVGRAACNTSGQYHLCPHQVCRGGFFVLWLKPFLLLHPLRPDFAVVLTVLRILVCHCGKIYSAIPYDFIQLL